MIKKIRFTDMFNNRMNEISASIDKTSTKGDARGLFFLIPYVLIISFFEYLWKRITMNS